MKKRESPGTRTDRAGKRLIEARVDDVMIGRPSAAHPPRLPPALLPAKVLQLVQNRAPQLHIPANMTKIAELPNLTGVERVCAPLALRLPNWRLIKPSAFSVFALQLHQVLRRRCGMLPVVARRHGPDR